MCRGSLYRPSCDEPLSVLLRTRGGLSVQSRFRASAARKSQIVRQRMWRVFVESKRVQVARLASHLEAKPTYATSHAESDYYCYRGVIIEPGGGGEGPRRGVGGGGA